MRMGSTLSAITAKGGERFFRRVWQRTAWGGRRWIWTVWGVNGRTTAERGTGKSGKSTKGSLGSLQIARTPFSPPDPFSHPSPIRRRPPRLRTPIRWGPFGSPSVQTLPRRPLRSIVDRLPRPVEVASDRIVSGFQNRRVRRGRGLGGGVACRAGTLDDRFKLLASGGFYGGEVIAGGLTWLASCSSVASTAAS